VCAEVLTVNIVITENVDLYPAEISPLIEQATAFHTILEPTLMQILFKQSYNHFVFAL